ncbi:hypothetical protein D6Z43_10285 [Pseudomonas sp. DY-1]|uniref:hypothetical protein n=1 Tax=Pseudomonas sp. DY-1 TaxID=1755504 RepID=UPI000EAA251A|nr:hypothetical protein [Pseudomonas sp. DY-1]AYF87515.1 hypothetical protein D6Z43_10285 [Pseudomonas sp. DY-1]
MDNCVTPACDTPSATPHNTALSHAEIHDALVEKRAVIVGCFVVDNETGEIIGEYAQTLASHALSRPSPHRAPDEVLSVDEWEDYLRQHVDRRKLPPHTTHALYYVQDTALGEHFRKSGDYRVSKPMMMLLLQLHELVLYRNVIVMSQTDLSTHLAVAESNLSAKLAKLVEAGLLKVFTSRNGDMRKGEIKLLINPWLVFRGSDALRDNAVKTWYRHQMRRDSQARDHDHVAAVPIAA